jgi:hypothetical protein
MFKRRSATESANHLFHSLDVVEGLARINRQHLAADGGGQSCWLSRRARHQTDAAAQVLLAGTCA